MASDSQTTPPEPFADRRESLGCRMTGEPEYG